METLRKLEPDGFEWGQGYDKAPGMKSDYDHFLFHAGNICAAMKAGA
jgi:hypothetical protein